MENTFDILTVCAVFVLAGFAKGVVGFGLPTVAMAVLGTIFDPAMAAALLLAPSLVTNLKQAFSGPATRELLRRLAPMLVATLAGAWGIATLGLDLGASAAMLFLGEALMVYAVMGLFAVRMDVPSRHERKIGAAVGLSTGIITAVTGVFVIPAVPFLQGLGLDKDRLVQAMGLFFTLATVALAGSLAEAGLLDGRQLAVSVLVVLPAWAGMRLGEAARIRLSPGLFRLCFFGGLLALGFHMVVNGV